MSLPRAAPIQRPPVHDDPKLVSDLRTDHAGETGAVWIYNGILAVTRDADLRAFATDHLATEQRHLDIMADLLSPGERTRLIPVWRVAGWITGALPALAGPRAVYATIDAVETFVDRHYQEQIDRLAAYPKAGALRQVLIDCQADEVHHRDEARDAAHGADGLLLRAWTGLVRWGSSGAVTLSRWI